MNKITILDKYDSAFPLSGTKTGRLAHDLINRYELCWNLHAAEDP